VWVDKARIINPRQRGQEPSKLPSLGAEREEIARWAILAKEPDCRVDLWWRGWGWVSCQKSYIYLKFNSDFELPVLAKKQVADIRPGRMESNQTLN